MTGTTRRSTAPPTGLHSAITARQRLVGLAAAVGLLGIVLGLPVLFLAIGADPIPDRTPSLDQVADTLLSPDDGRLVLGLLTAVGWLAWALMTLSLAVEAVAQIRRTTAPRLPGLHRPQAAAHGLIALAALLFITAPIAVQAGASAPAFAAPEMSHLPSVGARSATPASGHSERAHAGSQRPATTTPAAAATVRHTVAAGENLWSIAEEHLGDGNRYDEIFALNRHLLAAGPDVLEPGWVLTLPAPHGGTTPEGATAKPYVVRPGDSLSGIAKEQLGDANRWPEIYRASTDTTQLGGRHLTDPDFIDVGWRLTVPKGTDARLQRASSESGSRSQAARPSPSTRPATVPTRSPDAAQSPQSEPSLGTQPQSSEAIESRESRESREPTVADRMSSEQPEANDQRSVLTAPWILAGLTGGGVLLSGALLMGLQSRRRTAYRNRPPGLNIAAPPPELVPVEMTLRATGASAMTDVEFIGEALQRLSAAVRAQGGAMPALGALELSSDALALHLTAPAYLPEPWSGSEDRTQWRIETGRDLTDIGPDPDDVEPPYPLLVTIGTSDDGATWLLNCEELAPITIGGDPVYGRDLARHLAAQVALNPWSRRVKIDCIGVAKETVGLDERISYYDPDRSEVDRAIADTHRAADATIDRATRHGVDVATARTGVVDDDAWPAQLLMIDATASHVGGLDQLLETLAEHAGHTATTVVVAGNRPETPGTVLHMTDTGRIHLEKVGLDLVGVGLTPDEARGCALVYAHSRDDEYAEAPIDHSVAEEQDPFADLSGALRAEHTLPRDNTTVGPNGRVGDADESRSLLDDDDEYYLTQAPVLIDDLERLAPRVAAELRSQVEERDPTLDRDLADWFSDDCPRPRLSLLGPVSARTRGKALAKRKPYFTELLAYLALHRKHGATRDQIRDAFSITDGKVRDYTNIVRDWLGTSPETGLDYLPHADKAPSAVATGINVYQVDDGLLVDLDLFTRLRTRGEARGGGEGLDDLRTALELVGDDRPFSRLREHGWEWLANEPDRIDLMAGGWIADVALVVVTGALADDDLAQARWVAQIARRADPDVESARLCMAHVLRAEGDHLEADRILREEICNRDDDGDAPADLSERTKTIIRTHGWLAS